MKEPIHVTDAAFEKAVLKSPVPVIVDFWAPWCGPCRMVAPALEKLAAEYENKLIVAKVNTDDNPEWAMKYGVQGILVASYRVASLSAEGMAEAAALEDGERGVIILTASVAAQDGQIGQVIYASAKAGVNGLVLPMARDLSDLGIRVNCIMPGIFATPLMLGAKQNVIDSLSASVPFPKRLGKPEEFARLALEMARNTYLNAQSIRLDGAIRMAPR